MQVPARPPAVLIWGVYGCRSAAYISRYLAKNIVAAGVSDKCVIQLSYAIGVSQPLSIYIDLFNGDQKLSEKVESVIRKEINLSKRK